MTTTPNTLLDEAARVHHASASEALRNAAAALETLQAALDAAHADAVMLRAELNDAQCTARAVAREAIRQRDAAVEEAGRLRSVILAYRHAVETCDGWHEAELALLAAVEEKER
jgi:hypothetical protein